MSGLRIGLLGGSFNPAHRGHLHISRLALKLLDLDEVWWLVSPQNPLKPATGMAPFAARLRQAAEVAAGERRVRVTGIEAALGTVYTADTVRALRRRLPHARFVWLMGGDNLRQFPYWKRWEEVFHRVPVAVFDRPQTALPALAGKAVQRFAHARVMPRAARLLADLSPPAWVFFHARLDPRSATEIRAGHSRKETKINVIAEAAATLPATGSTATGPTATGPTATGSAATGSAARKPRRRERLSPDELLRRILAGLDDGKAEEIVTIDLAGKTTIADYMVVATGRSARQVTALTEHLERDLPGRVAVEGKAQGDWVLIDAGDVIIHIFRPEIRAYYNLEKMWGSDLPGSVQDGAEAVMQ